MRGYRLAGWWSGEGLVGVPGILRRTNREDEGAFLEVAGLTRPFYPRGQYDGEILNLIRVCGRLCSLRKVQLVFRDQVDFYCTRVPLLAQFHSYQKPASDIHVSNCVGNHRNAVAHPQYYRIGPRIGCPPMHSEAIYPSMEGCLI